MNKIWDFHIAVWVLSDVFIFLPEMCTFGRKYFYILSRIIVVNVHATVFFSSKVHLACHNNANGIKPGSNSKKTDKHPADRSKAVCMGVK